MGWRLPLIWHVCHPVRRACKQRGYKDSLPQVVKGFAPRLHKSGAASQMGTAVGKGLERTWYASNSCVNLDSYSLFQVGWMATAQPENLLLRCSATLRMTSKARALASLWNMDRAISYLRPVESMGQLSGNFLRTHSGALRTSMIRSTWEEGERKGVA